MTASSPTPACISCGDSENIIEVGIGWICWRCFDKDTANRKKKYTVPIAPVIAFAIIDEPAIDCVSILDDWDPYRKVSIYHMCLSDNGAHPLAQWDWIGGHLVARLNGSDSPLVPIREPERCEMCQTRLVSEEWEAVVRDIRRQTRHWRV